MERGRKLAERARQLNQSPALLAAAKRVRELLPGDSRFGDPLSTGGEEGTQRVGRRLSVLASERPGVMGELGMGALQLWQGVSEASGRGRGERELAILFTDLVEFSSWALEAGDDAALVLLRDVSEAIEPPVEDHGGDVVKRLGDGMMAVFDEPPAALQAVAAAHGRLAQVEAPGYRPRMRAGLHLGRPRRLGGDYLGVDVNIAARMAEQASGDELLLSERVLETLDGERLEARRKRRFRVKGVPKDVSVYSVDVGPKGP